MRVGLDLTNLLSNSSPDSRDLLHEEDVFRMLCGPPEALDQFHPQWTQKAAEILSKTRQSKSKQQFISL